MKKHILVLLNKISRFIFLSLFIVSCGAVKKKKSSEYRPEDIIPGFTVSYNRNDRKGSATAVFSIKRMTQLELDGESKVFYNGARLPAGDPLFIGGFYYETKLKIYPDEHTFEYIDNNGKTYKNKVFLPELFITDSIIYNPQKKFCLKVNRNPIEKEEVYVYFLSDDLESEGFFIQTDDVEENGFYDEESKTIFIKGDFMTKFRKSKIVEVTLSGEKHFQKLKESPGERGDFNVSYEHTRKFVMHRR